MLVKENDISISAHDYHSESLLMITSNYSSRRIALSNPVMKPDIQMLYHYYGVKFSGLYF